MDCRISSTELYVPPKHDTPAARKAFPYCRDRKSLLDALNSGGRHGFDEPFTPKGLLHDLLLTHTVLAG